MSKKNITEAKEIIKRQFEQVQLARQRFDEITKTRNTLIENFGSLTNALAKMSNIKTNDPATNIMQQIRHNTESFQRVMEKHAQDMATINPLTGAVRKQRFKKPELTNQVVQMVSAERALDLKIKTKINNQQKLLDAKIKDNVKKLSEFLKNKNKPEPKKKVEILADGRKRTHLLYGYDSNGDGSTFQNWLWDNDVLDMFGIVKHYKKKKTRYEPQSWEDLIQVLRSLNFRPSEVLEYSISKIQTKERFLEHRLYRNIKAQNASGLTEFIDIYKKHLKTKLPFKSFFYSKHLATWCASQDIFFKSEENCRINKDLLLKAYNKLNPQDKISDKKKK